MALLISYYLDTNPGGAVLFVIGRGRVLHFLGLKFSMGFIFLGVIFFSPNFIFLGQKS